MHIYSVYYQVQLVCIYMIIGFLGKGGSGKSTLAYRFTQYLHSKGNDVLAIDADHNMDLSYNFKLINEIPYVGQSISHIRKVMNLEECENYANVFLREAQPPVFSIDPLDSYTKQWSVEIDSRLRLMTAGPHTEGILHGGGCSHTLYTPLKIYLPLLNLKEDQYVVIDEKAGTDSVGTGITTGFDFVFVCVEPTLHGIKAAKQIATLLDFFDTPHAFVWNKVRNEKDRELLEDNIKEKSFIFTHMDYFSNPEEKIKENEERELENMLSHAKGKLEGVSRRYDRTKEKFKRNHTYKLQ